MYDMIIIGAGTAGLSAAIYALRAGHSVLVLEAELYGGQITSSPEVENYPGIKRISGADFAMNLYNQAADLGAEVKFEAVTGVELSSQPKKVTTEEGTYEGKAVIIANGAKRRKLGAKGEEEFEGRGVSYCATCDGAFYRGKVTAIVGGGNTALEDAIFLANNCERVHVIHRRDEFRGNKILSDALIARENVEIHYNSAVKEIAGTEKVEKLVLKNTQTGEQSDLLVDGVFVAVGMVPENGLFAGMIDLDQAGYIVADESCKTKIPGVYVAGDTRTKTLRQLVGAAADGAQAAVEASHFITAL